MAADWNKLKKEYMRTGISQRALAEKYGIPYGTLRKVAAKEQWTTLRNKIAAKADAKMVEEVAARQAKVGEDIFAAADLLMQKLVESVKQLNGLDSQSLRQYTAALKDLKDIKIIRSQEDLEEQKARIAKLQREAQKDADSKNTTIEVVFAAGEEEWNE